MKTSKRIAALALMVLMLLSLSVPGYALEILLYELVKDAVEPFGTEEPTPTPTPEPTPTPWVFDASQAVSSSFNNNQSILLPTPTPLVGSNISDTYTPPKAPLPILTAAPATAIPATPRPATPKPASPPASPTQAQAVAQAPQQPGLPGAGTARGKNAEATSFGLYVKELRPTLTDKWYLLTPVNLSQEGLLSYPLIADNAHIIGNITITIRAGQLRVDYQVVSGVAVSRELLTFFADVDSIPTLNPDLLAGQNHAFSQNLDIQQTFGEDHKVLLYINLLTNYKTNLKGISAFAPEQHRSFMVNLMALLD